MLRTIGLYLVLVVIVCPHVVSRVQSRGPFGGKITALDVTIGGTILAVSDSAIYRSEQEGYWELVTPDENKNTPECFLNYDRDIVLAGTSRGVYRSEDDGKSWNALSHTLSFGRVNSLLAMSQKEIFLGTERGELYHSTDKGDHWFTITLPIRNESIVAIATDAKGTLYVGTTKGHIFLSGDAGIQWRVREAPFIQYPLSTLSVSSDGKLLAGSRGGGIVRWNEKSSRWENISADFPFQLINKLITAQHDQIFALTDIGGILASTDAGDHWVSLGLLKHHLSVLSIDTRQRLLAGSEKGLFRSTKDRSWEPIGVPSVSISVLGSLNPGFLIAGSNEEGIFISTDDGISWIPSSKGLAGNNITAFAQISSTCLAVGVMPTPPQRTSGGIHISLDSGKTWIQTGLINVNVSSIISIGTVTIAGTDSGMYRSGNDWKIWKKLSPANGVQRITSMAASRSGVVFAGTRSGLYQSLDTGLTWQKLPELSASPVSKVIASGDSITVLSLDTILMSFDAGRKWKALVRNSSHEEIKDFALAPGGKMYYAVATGVYLSTDSGNAWKKMPVDGSGCAINTFVLNSDSSLVIGSDRLGVILQ